MLTDPAQFCSHIQHVATSKARFFLTSKATRRPDALCSGIDESDGAGERSDDLIFSQVMEVGNLVDPG